MSEADPLNEVLDAEIHRMYNELGRSPTRDEVSKRLWEKYPQRVEEWLEHMKTTFVRRQVSHRVSLARKKWAKLARRDEDLAAQHVFEMVTLYVPSRGVHMKLGDMTGPDHASVAERYEVIEVASRARGELHSKLAELVGDRTTREAVSADMLTRRFERAYNTERQVEFSKSLPKSLR